MQEKKETLVASAFCAIENNVTLVNTAEEVKAQLKEEYSKKLELENCNLPDPFKLETGWMEEEDGIGYWPIIPVMCILNFLMINSDITDLKDYKASKGYSYFKQSWLRKISYRAIGSEHCFIRADCRPSE